MKHFLFFTFVLVAFTGCLGTKTYNYSPQQDKLTFKVDKQKYFDYKLINPQFKYSFDNCTNESYTISDASIFLEYISLNSNCRWNGSSNGFFEYQIKDKLKLKSLTMINRLEVDNYIFSTLKVNETHKLQTVHYWATYTDLFIIDYDGRLTFSLLKELDAYEKFESSTLPRYVKRYNQSLVHFNFLNSYFNADTEIVVE